MMGEGDGHGIGILSIAPKAKRECYVITVQAISAEAVLHPVPACG